jgi:hypothetical protein
VKSSASALVPWIDHNLVSRTPRTSWHAGLALTPATEFVGWRLGLRAELTHQGDMYERGIEVLSFGARTLLDARL